MMAGVRFDAVIEDAIRHGVLVAIYTDSYSSREWCRREAILAKRHGVPMLVIDCLQDKDDRAFPYLWNKPSPRDDWVAIDCVAVAACRHGLARQCRSHW